MRLLIVAAHPDDEVLGPGATIASLSREPHNHVSVLIVSEGVSLRHPGVTRRAARNYCMKAAGVLGVEDLRFGGFGADGQIMGDGPQAPVVRCISKVIEDTVPDTLFTHHSGDINIDHRVVSDSVTYAAKVMGLGPWREVLHFEVLSSTEQQLAPQRQMWRNVYYDVSGFVDIKCEALSCYPFEVFPYPHPRSIESVRNLAAVRGCEVGVPQAEAFFCARQLRAGGSSRLRDR